jgi:hypothetical protein
MTLISRGCNRLTGVVENWINGGQLEVRAPYGTDPLAAGNSSFDNFTERMLSLIVSRGISE